MAMEKIVLVVNRGSSSKKYALYRGEEMLLSGSFVREGEGYEMCVGNGPNEKISEESFFSGLSLFLEKCHTLGIIASATEISLVGMRIVSPGVYFQEHHIIDANFCKALQKVSESDPVHIEPILAEIDAVSTLLSHALQVGVSDSAFHASLPENAFAYALPEALRESGVRRFGYHGISVASVMHTLKEKFGGVPERTIVCHLGSGASVTALRNGKSVDTSMGYSPLEGLVMSTRIGDIDVGGVLQLLKEHTSEELQKLFYTQSGLLALSGLSADMKVLLEAEKEGHEGALRAVSAFVRGVQKYIGAYTAVLGGVDAIVYTGTIGEKSGEIRSRICSELSWLGVSLDRDLDARQGAEGVIGSGGPVKVFMLSSDESRQIVREAMHFLG